MLATRLILVATIAGCMVAPGCGQSRPQATLLVPDGYRGVIRIVFSDPKGRDLNFDAGKRLVLRIPRTGTLRLRAEGAEVRGKYVLEQRTYSGKELPNQMGMFDSPDDREPPDGPVRAFMSRMNDRVEWVGYVGTDRDLWRDKRALEALYGD